MSCHASQPQSVWRPTQLDISCRCRSVLHGWNLVLMRFWVVAFCAGVLVAACGDDGRSTDHDRLCMGVNAEYGNMLDLLSAHSEQGDPDRRAAVNLAELMYSDEFVAQA